MKMKIKAFLLTICFLVSFVGWIAGVILSPMIVGGVSIVILMGLLGTVTYIAIREELQRREMNKRWR